MKKKGLAAAAVILGVMALSVVVALWARGSRSNRSGLPSVVRSGDTVGIVRVEGTIADGSGGSLFGGEVLAQDIIDQLDDAADDPTISAVVLRINSPGGSASASWEIAEAIQRVKDAGKPVVVSMGDSAASGGYWIAAGADWIVATPSTLTGSIGVIMETANMEELFNKIGYQSEVIKSGPYKDIGSSSREMLPEERTMLQQMVDNIYQQFVQVVAEGRHMTLDAVRAVADGRVMTGSQAKELGLVDELGDLHAACLKAGELAGIEGDVQVEELGAGSSPLQALFGAKMDDSSLEGLAGEVGKLLSTEPAHLR